MATKTPQSLAQRFGYRNYYDMFIGDYDYRYLCTPQFPFSFKGERKAKLPPFLANDANLSWLLGGLMGMQQSLAQATGNIGPPLVLGSLALIPGTNITDQQTVQYLLSAAFILSGFFSFLQILRFKIPGTNIWVGSGLLTVLGASFAFIPSLSTAVKTLQAQGNTFDEAFGRILGTLMVVGLIQIGVSFIPYKQMIRAFPPMIIGTLLTIIGAALFQAGFYGWGGGSFCGQNSDGIPGSYGPLNTTQLLETGAITPEVAAYCNNATDPVYLTPSSNCYTPPVVPLCNSGDVNRPWGSSQFVALGASFYGAILLIEFFGSPFMRNTEVMIAMLFAYFLTAVVHDYDPNYPVLDSAGQPVLDASGNIMRGVYFKFLNKYPYEVAPDFNFLWTKTFKVGFYAPAFLPLCVATVVSIMDNMAAMTSTSETAKLPTSGPELIDRIKGGLIVDGLSTSFAGFAGTTPSVTYNINGVMAMSRCAARQAGIWCAIFYIIFGIVGKFSAFFAATPAFVLGPALTYVCGCLFVAGVQIISMDNMESRRNKFLVGTMAGLGLGAQMVPGWAQNLWILPPNPTDAALTFKETVDNILSSGLCMAALSGIILNLIMPFDNEEDMEGISLHDKIGVDGPKHKTNADEFVVEKMEEDGSGKAEVV